MPYVTEDEVESIGNSISTSVGSDDGDFDPDHFVLPWSTPIVATATACVDFEFDFDFEWRQTDCDYSFVLRSKNEGEAEVMGNQLDFDANCDGALAQAQSTGVAVFVAAVNR